MASLKQTLAILTLCCAATKAMAEMHIFAYEPEWAALAKELVCRHA